jgi:tetratricopeptide (TPR) repeat protein
MLKRPVKGSRWPYILLIVIAVIAAYYKLFHAGFMSWDDGAYVTHNSDIRSFRWENIHSWFSQFYVGNYHPLTMVSYAADFMIGGNDPFIYHLINMLLHAANAVLVFAFVSRLKKDVKVALFVALLFALHPVQTESVSWIAERKNVLYGFFFLVTLYQYAVYTEDRKKWRYLVVVFAGIASMLSKPAAVTLPLSLFAVDIWLQRPFKDRRVWIEKIPLLVSAIVFGMVAVNAQQEGEFLNLHPEYSWLDTVVFAGYAYVQYLVHLLVPVKLSVLYPYPQSVGLIHLLYTLIAVLILALGVVAWRRRWLMLCGGIVFYTVNIAIVLQFVQFGEVLMADRYLYIAGIGVWMPLVWYLYQLMQKNAATAALGLAVVIIFGCTWTRNDIWLSELAFWQAIADEFPESSVAQSSLGGVYMEQGDNVEALRHIDRALSIDDHNYKAWYNRGSLLLKGKDMDHALDALNRCIAISGYPKAMFTRALIYEQTGRPVDALKDIDKVLDAEPDNARAYYIKGRCLEQQGQLHGAIRYYDLAIQNDENEPLYDTQKAVAEAKLGQTAQALNDLNVAIGKNENFAGAWYWRGLIKHQLGQQPCGDLQHARKLGSRDAEAAIARICN